MKKRILSIFVALSMTMGACGLSVNAETEAQAEEEASTETVSDTEAAEETTEETTEEITEETDTGDEEAEDISYFTYEITDGNVTITDCNEEISGDVVVPSTIEECPVTTIGNFAFQNCALMESIALPDTVTSIGNYAISYCTSLTQVDMPPVLEAFGNGVFSGCTNLSNIEIPEGVANIREFAFYNCTSLESVQLPETVTSISQYAFNNCSSLVSINFPGVTTIGIRAFTACTALESIQLPQIVSIGDWAFDTAKSVKSITFGESLVKIGKEAFIGCNTLEEIIIPGSVTNIGDAAFSKCTSLKRAELLDGITYVGTSMFRGCTQLVEIVLPETVTVINSNAFNATGMTEFYISDNVTTIVGSAFYACDFLTEITVSENNSAYAAVDGILFNKELTELVKYPAAKIDIEYTIPEGVTTVSEYAFYKCENLDVVKMPDTVTAINDCAFDKASVQTVITSKNLKSIGMAAFRYCGKLKDIVLPEGLTEIGDYAFRYCSNLVSLTIPGTVTSVGWYLTASCSDLEVLRICEGVTNLPPNMIEYCGAVDVYIPSTITTFSTYSLYDATPSIYYSGSGEQWTEIFGTWQKHNVVEYNYAMNTIYNFVTNGGSAVASIEGDVSEAPVSTYNGMNFIGWYDNAELSGEPVTFPYSGEATTLYAKWESYYSYEINNDEITITGIDDSINGEITIPETLFGYPVTAIGDRAFYDNDNITKIYISSGVKSIGEYAFAECSNLTYIHTGKALSMGDYALKNCTALESVYIDEALEQMGTGVFGGCENLVAINVSSYNDSFTSVDGVLFNDDITVLIQYPMGKKTEKYVIPDTVITITPGAFDGYSGSVDCDSNENLSTDGEAITDKDGTTLVTILTDADEYTIPDGVMYIGENAFADCDNLVTLRMPDSVIDIADRAFYSCDSLKEVYYNGTKSQWKKIQIGTDNESLTNADIIFLGSVELSVSEVRGLGGETVSVDVMIDNNFGITSLGIELDYDASIMQLKDVQINEELGDVIVTTAKDFSVKPYNISFDSTQDFDFDGRLATLVFEIVQDAPTGEYPVTVDYYKGLNGTYVDGEDVNYNSDFEPVNIDYVSGKIKIYTPGDLDNDKRVTNKDATFMLRYLADWDMPDIVEAALDTDGSGTVDEFDATHLLRYIAKWNVELY